MLTPAMSIETSEPTDHWKAFQLPLFAPFLSLIPLSDATTTALPRSGNWRCAEDLPTACRNRRDARKMTSPAVVLFHMLPSFSQSSRLCAAVLNCKEITIADEQPDAEPKPVRPAELCHQVSAAHDTEDRYQRQPLGDAEESHDNGKQCESKVRYALEEHTGRRRDAFHDVIGRGGKICEGIDHRVAVEPEQECHGNDKYGGRDIARADVWKKRSAGELLSLTTRGADDCESERVPITERSVTSDRFMNRAGIATINPVRIVENHGVRKRGWIDEKILGKRPSRLIAIHKRGCPSWNTRSTVAIAIIADTAMIPDIHGRLTPSANRNSGRDVELGVRTIR